MLILLHPPFSVLQVVKVMELGYELTSFSKSTQWHHPHCSGMWNDHNVFMAPVKTTTGLTLLSICELASTADCVSPGFLAAPPPCLRASSYSLVCCFCFRSLSWRSLTLPCSSPTSPFCSSWWWSCVVSITHNNTEMSSHGYWFGTPVIQISSSLSNQLIAYIIHSNANERFLGIQEGFCTIWERIGDIISYFLCFLGQFLLPGLGSL